MFEDLITWIEGTGDLVYVLAPLFTVTVAILPIPAELPAALNGMVFGPVLGSLVTWLSAVAGAQVSFELARAWGRPLGRRILSDETLARADELVSKAGWPALLALRLMPAVAFTAVNWGAGLTLLRRWTFFWTTAIGILPGAIAFSTTGSGLIALSRRYGLAPVVWSTVAVLMLVAAIFLVRRRARGRPSARSNERSER